MLQCKWVEESVYEKIIVLASLLSLSFILAACGTSGEQKEPSKDSQKSEKYTYEYYEVLNNGSEDTPNVEIKYKDKMVNHIYKRRI